MRYTSMEGSGSIDFINALITVIQTDNGPAKCLYISEKLREACSHVDFSTPETAFDQLFPLASKPVFKTLASAIEAGEKKVIPYREQNRMIFVEVEGSVIRSETTTRYLNFHFSKKDSPAMQHQEGFQRNLFESRQLYQRIAENFPRGTIDVLDSNFRYIYTEGTEYKELSIDPTSLIGTCHLDLVHGDSHQAAKANLTQVLQGEMVTYETTLWNNYYQSNAVPLRNEEQEIDHILLVHQNITNAKKLEAEREVLIKDLESHNEELLRFAYIVSHNLRAPIVNISLLLDLYNELDPSDPENQEVIENLKVSTNLLNATLQDLIEVVSIKKQKIPKVEPINFHLLLNNIEKSLFNQLKESGIKIHKNLTALSEMNYVYAHLENFFMNFLTNSVKYKHPDRTPEVWIKTYKTDDYCVIEYRDNGIGLDLDRYGDRLFGLYQRFHNHVEGKGMGLYLVREQIRANDGKIETRSKVGEGLAFTIYLRNLVG
ncbi:MAG: PAS domain-containing protein [Lunatimonas sp.]|uniref:sensor histidine kinase n=1 Tax=Lunatimonas sp. TaxID=2060141 RepID=UPI00263A841C|nr:PAS domain-containing sensor histidine kinase [Lunatimonas sp.]MCC5937344.1 PAS domain-containing protein [Lunatimonas sp.]